MRGLGAFVGVFFFSMCLACSSFAEQEVTWEGLEAQLKALEAKVAALTKKDVTVKGDSGFQQYMGRKIVDIEDVDQHLETGTNVLTRPTNYALTGGIRYVAPEVDPLQVPNIPQRQVVPYPDHRPHRGGTHYTVSRVLEGKDWVFDF